MRKEIDAKEAQIKDLDASLKTARTDADDIPEEKDAALA